jgi:hypothetical protein
MAPILGSVGVGDGEWESDSMLESEGLALVVAILATKKGRHGQIKL